MKIHLRVIGCRLFNRLTREIAAVDSAFPRRLCASKPLVWQLEHLEAPFSMQYLDDVPERVSVVLIEGSDPYVLDELWAVGSQERAPDSPSAARPFPVAPVIVVFDREFPTSDWIETPAVVADWVSGPSAMHDLARRVIASLRRQKHLQSELGGGWLTLNLDTRTLFYNKQSVQLTPAEVPLAELFLAHLGSVIPLDEILLMFRLAGRSTSGSNLRVTIFQLRYKLELLTGQHFALACAYGEGYVLRPARVRSRSPAGHSSPARPIPLQRSL